MKKTEASFDETRLFHHHSTIQMNETIENIGHDATKFEECLQKVLKENWLDEQKHALNWRYQFASTTAKSENTSLAIFRNGNLVAISLSEITGNKLSYFGQDIMVMFSPDYDDHTSVLGMFIDSYLEIINTREINQFAFTTGIESVNPMLKSELALMNMGAKSFPRYYGMIDLTQSIEDLKKDIRKSYKSLINYGRREIELQAQSGATAEIETFNAYQALHERVAGRATRPQASWDAMFNMIQQGKAEILYGFQKNELVAASYFPNSAGTTIYGSAAYDREKFDTPLAHWPLFHQIERAKERGDKILNLGEVYLHASDDPKQSNIAYFKKGFTSRVVRWNCWSFKDGTQ